MLVGYLNRSSNMRPTSKMRDESMDVPGANKRYRTSRIDGKLYKRAHPRKPSFFEDNTGGRWNASTTRPQVPRHSRIRLLACPGVIQLDSGILASGALVASPLVGRAIGLCGLSAGGNAQTTKNDRP